MSKEIILTHPKLGDRTFPEVVAKKIMSIENNGGWEFKKKHGGVLSPPTLTQKDADNYSSVSPDTKDAIEERRNPTG